MLDEVEKALILINNIGLDDETDTLENYFDCNYRFATEMIKEYYKDLDFRGKQILTVMSSGDQVLNAILLGVREIDSFDINPLSIYYYKLKEAAIKSLTYSEFRSFFFEKTLDDLYYMDNQNIFSKSLYQKISPHLKGKYQEFWDFLYSVFDGKEIGLSPLFWPNTRFGNRYKDPTFVNLYLNEDSYQILKHILLTEKIYLTFQQENIKNLKVQEKYDYIFLSNISQYLHFIYKKNHLQNFKNLILYLANHLKNDGILFHSYLYDYEYYKKYPNSKYNQNFKDLYNEQIVLKELPLIEKKVFSGYNGNGMKDAVYMYRKC